MPTGIVPTSPKPATERSKVAVFSTSSVAKPRASVLYLGREKTGKTHNSMTYPSPLVINFAANTATLMKFPDIPVIMPGSSDATDYGLPVREFRQDIIPMIQNRRCTEFVRQLPEFKDYTVETLVLDDLTTLGYNFRLSLTKGGTGKMEFTEWARYLQWFSDTIKTLTDATRPDPRNPDRETYNIVAIVHEHHVLDSDGRLAKIVPMVEGQFKDQLCSKFDLVLVTDNRVVRDKTKPGQDKVEYFCHTVPPDQFRKAGGTGLGKTLPPHVGGTYPELMEAWGLS